MPNDTCDKVLQALRARNLDLERERIGLVVSGTNRVAGDLDGAHVSIALMVSAGSNAQVNWQQRAQHVDVQLNAQLG